MKYKADRLQPGSMDRLKKMYRSVRSLNHAGDCVPECRFEFGGDHD